MPILTDPLTFISDPGHGWLCVPLNVIAALGIEGDISSCSFIDTGTDPRRSGQFAYLEEDCDCAVFTQACEAQNIPLPTIQEQYVAHFNRNRPRFGDPQFSVAFWNDLRS